jgi:hypothetical protein
VGVLTDGVNWRLYRVANDGRILKVSTFQNIGDTAEFTVWLEAAIATKQAIAPTKEDIERRLGVDSAAFKLDMSVIAERFDALKATPELKVKRQLWERLLADALGLQFSTMDEGEKDELFIRHTYLVVIAEIIAHLVIGEDVLTAEPRNIASGAVFRKTR